MTASRALRIIGSLVAILLLAGACGDEVRSDTDGGLGVPPNPETVVVSVYWTAPSTPSDAKNSHGITVSERGSLATNEIDPSRIDPARWEEFVRDLPSALEGIPTTTPGEQCVGGGGISLTVEGAGDLDRDVDFMVCGGEIDPAAEKIEALIAPFARTVR